MVATPRWRSLEPRPNPQCRFQVQAEERHSPRPGAPYGPPSDAADEWAMRRERPRRYGSSGWTCSSIGALKCAAGQACISIARPSLQLVLVDWRHSHDMSPCVEDYTSGCHRRSRERWYLPARFNVADSGAANVHHCGTLQLCQPAEGGRIATTAPPADRDHCAPMLGGTRPRLD
jgi:hypothetical protein